MEAPAITCRGITKAYGSALALDGLDLEVPSGSLFGFLGPNGAGKTTLMRVLLGLTAPTGGTAEVFGSDIVTDSIAVRRMIGYLPQQPEFPRDLTARQLLRYARGFFPPERDARIEDDITDVLELVGLDAKADSRPDALSGGQRQRLGIAQAQIHRPKLLILDEPVSALDPLGRRDVLDLMQRLKESTTVFYSTHVLDDVQQVSDEVAILQAGRRVLQAPVDRLLSGEDALAFTLTLVGPIGSAIAALRSQQWVSEIAETSSGDRTTITVRVTDEATARQQLLRLVLADERVEVVDFGRHRSRLEDVFIAAVGGPKR